MKHLTLMNSFAIFALSLGSTFCVQAQTSLQIENAILKDQKSFYYINFKEYPKSLKNLPIGVFDSGTGGLTVLDALVNFDEHNNHSKSNGKDGILDFRNENFIYLADQANMPYGNYHSAKKDDLLIEHIIKDFQFLLSNKYYPSYDSPKYKSDKEKVKAIVIACNTATAYGYKDAEAFMNKTNLNVPVIGVINAAARGTLALFDKNESGSIAVFATVGTVASGGYERTLREQISQLGLTGDIQIYNQGGHGVAEAVDEEPDFIKRSAQDPRSDYRGPALDNKDFQIDRTLLDIYNFNFDKNQMLCDSKDTEDCSLMQINSSENYIRYHLVSLLEQMRKTEGAKPLKSMILGCTHYPYLVKEINQVLAELKGYKGNDGEFKYKALIDDEVHIIDPSVFVARELYEALEQKDLFNGKGDMLRNSEFYISVPNQDNSSVELEGQEARFTYNYKYGRKENEIQEYVKVVPFDKGNVSEMTLDRFKAVIPNTYELMRNFSNGNKKMKKHKDNIRIK
ncbi:glutamate racemase [Sphingobacterium cellulitidis]|uniref:glutamate racemase n=1 Tax=Sphingobacterium cellulitidis TaxID=1768011 RepID=UPI002692D462